MRTDTRSNPHWWIGDDLLQTLLSEKHAGPCFTRGKAMTLVSSKDELEAHPK